jgi:hypothetical protein
MSVWRGWRLHPFYPALGVFLQVGMAGWTCLNPGHFPLCGDGGFHHCHCFSAYGALPRARGWRDQGTDYTGSNTGFAWRGWRCVSFLRLRVAPSISVFAGMAVRDSLIRAMRFSIFVPVGMAECRECWAIRKDMSVYAGMAATSDPEKNERARRFLVVGDGGHTSPIVSNLKDTLWRRRRWRAGRR